MGTWGRVWWLLPAPKTIMDTILSILALLLGGGGGILALLNFWPERNKALAETIESLSKTVGTLSDEVDQLKKDQSALEKQNNLLLEGVKKLIAQLRAHNIDPVWMPED